LIEGHVIKVIEYVLNKSIS